MLVEHYAGTSDAAIGHFPPLRICAHQGICQFTGSCRRCSAPRASETTSALACSLMPVKLLLLVAGSESEILNGDAGCWVDTSSSPGSWTRSPGAWTLCLDPSMAEIAGATRRFSRADLPSPRDAGGQPFHSFCRFLLARCLDSHGCEFVGVNFSLSIRSHKLDLSVVKKTGFINTRRR